MPFADAHGLLPPALEYVRHSDFGKFQPFGVRRVQHIGNPLAGAIPAGHEPRPGGRAQGACGKVGETNNFFGNAVDVRSGDVGTETADVAVAKVVTKNQNNIRFAVQRQGPLEPGPDGGARQEKPMLSLKIPAQ
jgi:hypothetical protein